MSAYACEPGRGSECEIGWNLVHELAKSNRVWVITRANNKMIHDDAFAIHPKPPNLTFVYYDLPPWARWYKKGKRFFLIYYFFWQIGTIFESRRLLKHQDIDIAHHLTGGMDWMPSGLAFLGLPFVWGPVGSENVHPVIRTTLPLKVRVKEKLRSVVRYCNRELNPLVRYTGEKAQVILSHTPENMPSRYSDKVLSAVQTAIRPDSVLAKMKSNYSRGEIFTVIYAGELIHWKGASYAVEAFLRFSEGRDDVQLLVIGDGPLRTNIERMVGEKSMCDQVKFLGRLPPNELVVKLTLGDVFLYPTYHHGLATILLQSMLTGLPVVCLEGDAIGRVVGSEYGITVPLHSGDDFVGGLTMALIFLYENDTERESMGEKAQENILQNFSYVSIGKSYDGLYGRFAKSSKCGK